MVLVYQIRGFLEELVLQYDVGHALGQPAGIAGGVVAEDGNGGPRLRKTEKLASIPCIGASVSHRRQPPVAPVGQAEGVVDGASRSEDPPTVHLLQEGPFSYFPGVEVPIPSGHIPNSGVEAGGAHDIEVRNADAVISLLERGIGVGPPS